MRDGVGVGSVVVHGPDFLHAACRVDVVDHAFADAGQATAKTQDDFVGELVGDGACTVVIGVLGVLLAQHLRVLGVVRVKDVAVDRYAARSGAE